MLYICRAIKLPGLAKAVKSRRGGHSSSIVQKSSSNVRRSTRKKKTEEEDEIEEDPLGSQLDIVEIDLEDDVKQDEAPEKCQEMLQEEGKVSPVVIHLYVKRNLK